MNIFTVFLIHLQFLHKNIYSHDEPNLKMICICITHYNDKDTSRTDFMENLNSIINIQFFLKIIEYYNYLLIYHRIKID